MSEVFFISDTHFGHRGILQFKRDAAVPSIRYDRGARCRTGAPLERRPSAKRWPARHLGDFCFGKPEPRDGGPSSTA